jgi:replication factor C subunit 3/5
MRRVLNSLQACHAAYDHVTEEAVYITTGSPLPSDIEHISNLLFTADFATAYSGIAALKTDKGLALSDIVTELATALALMEIPSHVRAFLLDRLSTLEYDLHGGGTESLQLGALVGIYKLGIEMTTLEIK